MWPQRDKLFLPPPPHSLLWLRLQSFPSQNISLLQHRTHHHRRPLRALSALVLSGFSSSRQGRTDVLTLPGEARLYLTWLASCSLWHLYFKTHAVSFELSELSCSAHVIISLLQPCHYTSPPPPPQTLNSVLSASFACCNYSKFLWSSNWPSTKIFSSWLFWLWKHAIEMIFSFTSLLTVLIEYNLSGHSSGGTFIFLHWQRATPGSSLNATFPPKISNSILLGNEVSSF